MTAGRCGLHLAHRNGYGFDHALGTVGSGRRGEEGRSIGSPLARIFQRVLRLIGLGRIVRPRRATESAAFTTAFVSLAAKMAKADGVAVLAEELAF